MLKDEKSNCSPVFIMKKSGKEVEIYISYILRGKKKEEDGNKFMIRSFAN
jgi:hypothetical protein